MRQYLKLGHSAPFKVIFNSLFTIQSLELLIVRGTESIIKLDINNTNTEVLLTSEVGIKLSAFSRRLTSYVLADLKYLESTSMQLLGRDTLRRKLNQKHSD
jgi:hypothetical protein